MMKESMSAEKMLVTTYMLSVLRLCLLFILLCGLVYPLLSTGVAQLLMPKQANGSLIKDEAGVVVGSVLIGQQFNQPTYFHGRVSSISYQAEASGSNNYGPSNPALLDRMKETIAEWEKKNPDVALDQVPIQLLTNSASGLDPHISPQAANVQIPRISKETGVSEATLLALVKQHTEQRDLMIFGEPRVNVLQLNLALNEIISS
ncbi:potassium-transporting ATPase subunit KdpC [Paenibacillus yanchengensis]|uniref:Potassium-transporting ATPase KdpC subunit n=1 Tax=Paenibacillus yanchengensis TaxID=2035833 RepID=A0ABW4YFM5_9BACL